MLTTERDAPVIFKNCCMEVLLREQEAFLSIRWLQHPSSTQFRSNLLQLADLMAAHSCRRLLIDARAVLYLELADQHWVMRQLVPLLSSTLLELQACVVSEVSLELMDTDRMLAHLSGQENLAGRVITTRLFLDASHAREWLFKGL